MSTAGRGDIDVAAVEAWLDAAPKPVIAAWCGMDAQALTRLCQRIGMQLDRRVDVRDLLTAFATWIRDKQRAKATAAPEDDGSPLLEQKLKEEIRSLRKRREWVDERIKQLRKEYVPAKDVAERLRRLSVALLRAGDQLGQRHGAEAQETFNAALDGVVSAIGGRAEKKPKSRRKRKS